MKKKTNMSTQTQIREAGMPMGTRWLIKTKYDCRGVIWLSSKALAFSAGGDGPTKKFRGGRGTPGERIAKMKGPRITNNPFRSIVFQL